MDDLLDAITALSSLISSEKIRAIAENISHIDDNKSITTLYNVVNTPVAATVVKQLIMAWQKTSVSSSELAAMLLTASHVYSKATSEQSIELVWTGPTTPFVSARRTEQALLQVISTAERTLFITSFVAYDVSTIVKALNAANERGVMISILLELSQEKGGSLNFDTIEKMRMQVPSARLYVWHNKANEYYGGCVHAKVAVADVYECFITSANLTGHAMEKNIEAGVLISGGSIPKQLNEHLFSLIQTKVICLV
ncbi:MULTISPECIES: DISARM system phospholipase D-like protein DrmC [Klebsiella]|uniref:DISARM system phospholipase D-like protein DrmC n=1 Tax=Klebsiella TaxID=570 RepID=UPI000590B6EF|nr:MULTISPECIES: DISARM system phospholipase D-like protein DrmC [Klebsiella]HBQ4470796.1 phospholipase [Klebsiella pneumoniae subsp. pneumoniae]EIX9466433.1 phospholipase [Klebsiella pneumoniae]EKQ1180824.1 phospholipase [Klebsiella pneumoniae]EKZ2509585.1 phospholipase [Klebsiella pneumoniae]EKZ5942813.1 phospholipase [Klebsiella pneumoniae]